MELRKSIERAHVLELNRLSVMKCADPHARGQKSQVRGQPPTPGLRRAEAGAHDAGNRLLLDDGTGQAHRPDVRARLRRRADARNDRLMRDLIKTKERAKT